MKKDDSIIIWVIIIAVALFLFWYGGNQGWFKGSFSFNPPPASLTPFPDQVKTEYLFYNANLGISPNTVCVGDMITGTITSNIPNGFCSIFINAGTGMKLFTVVNLDANGDYSDSTNAPSEGVANFVAVCCDSNQNCKLSNSESLAINTCDTCIDSDGDNRDTPGNVQYKGDIYTDKCLEVGQAVTEYICVNNAISSKNWACDYGEICVQTRSGGHCVTPSVTCANSYPSCNGECPSGQICNVFQSHCICIPSSPPLCSDSDNGQILTVKGTCTDADSSDVDYCPIGNFNSAISEGFCSGNVCLGVSAYCPTGTTCYDGACVSTSQDSDHDGWSDIDELEQGFNPNDSQSHPPSTQDEMCNTYCGQMGYGMYQYDLTINDVQCLALANNKCVSLGKSLINNQYTTIGCCCWSCG